MLRSGILALILATSCFAFSEEAINVRQIDTETLIGIFEGKLPHLALEISKEEQLPLTLFLEGDFVELLGESELFVKAKQDIYIKNIEGKFLFSKDNVEWRPLLNWITGEMTAALSAHEPGEPTVVLGAKIFEK